MPISQLFVEVSCDRCAGEEDSPSAMRIPIKGVGRSVRNSITPVFEQTGWVFHGNLVLCDCCAYEVTELNLPIDFNEGMEEAISREDNDITREPRSASLR